jgi:hypothetical protein
MATDETIKPVSEWHSVRGFHQLTPKQMEPQAMEYSGDSWGKNPRLPTHPVGAALMRKNGLL